MTVDQARRWNHNIHYHRRIIDVVPPRARTALDVGTGNGLLAAELHRRVPHVVGLDSDAAVLESARCEDAGVTWLHGEVMSHPFEPASFDVVASVATLHHLPDLEATLTRFAELTAPGGVVAAVGLARSSSARDWMYDGFGLVAHAAYSRSREQWEHSAPVVWPPPHTYAEVKQSAKKTLPGSTFTRLAMWRYALVWRKPAT